MEHTEPASRRESMTRRFTLDGSDALEARLEELCAQVAEGVGSCVPRESLAALLLGGGYGRGEGGVLRAAAGDEPYNDLEFYVLVTGARPGRAGLGERLHALAEKLTLGAGIEIEMKLLPLEKLRHSPVTMFYYDLMAGHRLVLGQPSVLNGCGALCAPEKIPLHEAARLLMNRCSGLLFSMERLQRNVFTAEDADFVCRNVFKARLALGDVLLTAAGQYHWSCRERHERLERLPPPPGVPAFASIQREHAAGVEFKLHPFRSRQTREELSAEWDSLRRLALPVWLWLEGRRLGDAFASARDYARREASKCPETFPAKNFLINLRHFRALQPRFAARYPRERLLRALPLLLWDPQALSDEQEIIQSCLRTSAAGLPGVTAAYFNLWKHFN